jgi:hypothetical protein
MKVSVGRTSDFPHQDGARPTFVAAAGDAPLATSARAGRRRRTPAHPLTPPSVMLFGAPDANS